jgi:hypothetical protein
MDISGPVRGILQQHAGAPQEADPLFMLVRAVAHPDQEIAGLPAFLAPDAPLLAAPDETCTRPIHRWLALASTLRLLPRVSRQDRPRWREGLRRQVDAVVDAAQQLLLARSTPPVAFLWHHYLLRLAEVRGGFLVSEHVVRGTWRRGIAGQSAAGHLHPRSAETVVETFTYEELGALHAAYNAALLLEDGAAGQSPAFDSLLRMVAWHVGNTQPDHGTQEPWALAAFAALDETGTFALQQIHDARARVETTPGARRILLALLADAVITQEESAETR